MANNTYITEAFEKLNKMSRMSDSKKSLKESSRGRNDYKSYILNSLKDSGYSNFARVYSDYDFNESNGRNVVIDDTAKKIEIPNNMSIERIVRELTSKSRANSYKESSRRGLKESEDEEVEISTCAVRLDTRSFFYNSVLSDLNERIRDNELSIIEENHDPLVEYVIQGNEDSIYSFLHENRRMIMDYEYLPQDESYGESLTEAANPYNGFTVEDEDSHYVIRDFIGNIQYTADTPEEAHQIIDSELGTKQVVVNVNKFPDLESYCKKFNLSIVNQERAPYIEYTLQGDLNNINTLIDYINQYK